MSESENQDNAQPTDAAQSSPQNLPAENAAASAPSASNEAGGQNPTNQASTINPEHSERARLIFPIFEVGETDYVHKLNALNAYLSDFHNEMLKIKNEILQIHAKQNQNNAQNKNHDQDNNHAVEVV